MKENIIKFFILFLKFYCIIYKFIWNFWSYFILKIFQTKLLIYRNLQLVCTVELNIKLLIIILNIKRKIY